MSAEEVDAVVAWGDESSDAELITAARGGSAAAFGALYERHAAAARTVARQYTRSSADAEDVVSDAFARVYSIVRGGGGPDVAFRAYLFTVVRRLAHTRAEAGRRVQPTDDMATFETAFGSVSGVDDPALAGFERGVVAKAYGSLPERWQAVLWYTEIERLPPAQVAPLLGLTANGVAALAYRAREGLREAYLQQHLVAAPDDTCRTVNGKLGSYVRGGLAKRESAQVRAHLETCETCRSLVLELGDVNHGLRGIIAPLVLGVAGLGALASPLPVGVLASVGAGVGASAGVGAGVGGGAGAVGTAGSGAAAGAGGASVGAGAAVGAGTGAGGAAGGVAAGGATSLATAGAAAGTSGAAGSLAAGTAAAGSSVAGGLAGTAAGAQALAGGAVAGSTLGGTTAGALGAGTLAGAGTTAGLAGATTAGLAGATTAGLAGASTAGLAGASTAGLAGTTAGLAGAGAVTGASVAGATGAVAATGAVTAGAATVTGATALAGAGAASSMAAVGGIGGLVAALPGGVAGVVTAGVVGVSLAVGGVMSEPGDTRMPTSAAPTAPVVAAPPAGAPTDGGTGTPGAPSAGTGLGALLGEPVLAVPGESPAPGAPTPDPEPGDPAGAPADPGPTTDPVPPPLPGGGGTTVDPAPEPIPLELRGPTGSVALVAGGDTPFTITLVNTGGTDATDLRAALRLPIGVSVVTPGAGQWQPCADDAAGPPVDLCLDALAGGQSTVLSAVLRVSVDAPVDAATSVAVSVTGTGAVPQSLSVGATVQGSPAEVVLGPLGAVDLDEGAGEAVSIDVANIGRTAASDVVATLALPAGVRWAGDAAEAQPWSCVADGGSITCRLGELAGQGSTDLRLTLVADASAAGASGLTVGVSVGHAGGVTRSDALPVSVRPAAQGEPLPPVAPLPPAPEVVEPLVVPLPGPPVDLPAETPVTEPFPPSEG